MPELASTTRKKKLSDEKGRLVFSQYNSRNRSALRPRRYCYADTRSLEASRSRVGIAERDDILWFRCIFGASGKGPLRARCDHHAARSWGNGHGAIGATT